MAFDEKGLESYVDVAERISEFRDRYPEGTLQPADPARPWQLIQAEGFDKGGELVHQTFLVYVAAAYRTPDDQRPGIGAAWEVFPGRTPYTRGSELMNAETSAWGRAIIAVGAADAKRGVASRQEVAAARAQRNAPPEVRADGSATEAELERMRSGPELGAWRSTSTAENDPHYDQPAAVENQPRTSLKEQRQGIYIALGKRGIKDHKAAIERLTRRDITEPRDMSYNEAVSVRARVDSWDGRTEELLAPLVDNVPVDKG